MSNAISPNRPRFVRTLECSSKGHKAYSAFYAKVSVLGHTDIIENHYQLAKRFGDYTPKTWRDAKGKKPTHFVVGKRTFNLKYLNAWYSLLWVKYLDSNPDLVTYASDFDEFTDMFKVEGCCCQADVIRKYVKEGRQYVIDDCTEFLNLLRG